MQEPQKPGDGGKPPKDVMGFLEYYLVTKAPFQLPESTKEWIVKYAPWIDIVLLVLFAPLILFALGLGTIAIPFMGAGAVDGAFDILLLIVQIGLMIAALPGLFARKKSGWNFSFFSTVSNLIFSLANGSVIGGLLSTLISLYFLFQVRSYYRD